MSDTRERSLARAGLEGDLLAAQKLLRARTRSGVLSPGGLRLLGYLGDPAALALLSGDAPTPPAGLRPWLAGLQGMGELGRHASARAAWACACRVSERLHCSPAGLTALAGARASFEAWLECPGREQVEAVGAQGPSLRRLAYGAPESTEGLHLSSGEAGSLAASIHAARALFDAVHLIGYGGLYPPGGEPADGRHALRSLRYGGMDATQAEAELREAVRFALLPWARAGAKLGAG